MDIINGNCLDFYWVIPPPPPVRLLDAAGAALAATSAAAAPPARLRVLFHGPWAFWQTQSANRQ